VSALERMLGWVWRRFIAWITEEVKPPKPWTFLVLYIAYAAAVFLGWLWIEKAFPLPPVKVEEVKP
jgi:hypothetical protein